MKRKQQQQLTHFSSVSRSRLKSDRCRTMGWELNETIIQTSKLNKPEISRYKSSSSSRNSNSNTHIPQKRMERHWVQVFSEAFLVALSKAVCFLLPADRSAQRPNTNPYGMLTQEHQDPPCHIETPPRRVRILFGPWHNLGPRAQHHLRP